MIELDVDSINLSLNFGEGGAKPQTAGRNLEAIQNRARTLKRHVDKPPLHIFFTALLELLSFLFMEKSGLAGLTPLLIVTGVEPGSVRRA
jgi:hypothetical protein